MRIGIDAREAFRPEPRGIGLYVRNLMREFGALAPDDEFVLYHELPPLPPESMPLPANCRTRRSDLPGSRFHTWERLQVPWRLRIDRVDVYHGTYNTLPPRWRLWPGPPLVVTLHDVIVTWWPDDLDDSFVRYARAVTPRVVRDAAVILTVSEWSRGDICARFGCAPERVRVTLNGLHPDVLRGAPPGAGEAARERFAGGRPYLFAIGAGLERKNTGRMIDAFGELRRRRPDWPHLLLVSGVGRDGGRFGPRAAAAGVGDHVRFLPYLDRRDLVALYAGAACTVYPSLIEGWGLPVSESLAIGTPVVTSSTSAMPEAGGRFARYFDPEVTESIAAAMVDAVEHYAPAFQAEREAAMAWARQLTWTETARQVLAAYRDAVRG